MTAVRFGKEVFVAGASVADARSEAHAQMLIDAVNACPVQSFERARAIGEQLHDRWHTISKSEPPFGPNDIAWGDIVQFVVRLAIDPAPLVRKRPDPPPPPGERARYSEGETA